MTSEPLSARVRLEPVRVPPDGDGVRWRPPTADDIDRILDCQREMDAVDHPSYTTTRGEIADDFARENVDPARDMLVAEDEGGRILAHGEVIVPLERDSEAPAYVWGGVRPSARGRGLGRALLAWQRARALEHLSRVDEPLPGWIVTYVDEVAVASSGPLLARFGLEVRRWFTTLTRELGTPIPEPAAYDDLELRSPTDADAEAVRIARNAAFRDHWGSQPRSASDWALRWAGETERHDLSSIAVDADGAVAGLVLTEVNPEDFGPQGYSSVYVSLVGTVAAHRRRGLAAALLSRSMRLAAAEGLERAVLDVDSASPTGAVGLYTRLGFAAESGSRAYVLEV